MRKAANSVLCVVLAFSLFCSGCTSFRTKYRPSETEASAFNIACYWEDFSGEKHYVRGLTVTLSPRAEGAQDIPVITPERQPVLFRNLPPGKYRLTISDGESRYVDESVTLKPGRELRARFQVHGQAAQEVASDVAEGLGKAFVIVATAAIVLGIAYLEAEAIEDESLSLGASEEGWTIVIHGD